ncbi:MAG: hypothetical protein AMXMBFR20_06880 [Planctomycetia bacterium]
MAGDQVDGRRDDRPLILIVDDDPDMVGLLATITRNHGFRSTLASDCESALAICEKYRPNVVLLDIKLSGPRSGFDVCRELKANLGTADIPVFFVTGLDRSDPLLSEGFEVGAHDIIFKPISSVDLLGRLRVALREQQTREAYRKLALQDPFTGLSNRRQLIIHVTEALMSSRRDGSVGGMIIADIDHLMVVNDRHGYDLGDELILTLSRLMRRLTGQNCLAGRLGGDEMALVMMHTTRDAIKQTADRLRRTFAAIAFDATTQPKHFTLGVGCTAFGGEASTMDADAVLRQADTSLFAAKLLGRGRSNVFWELDAENLPVIEASKRHSRTKRREKTNRSFVGVQKDVTVEPDAAPPASPKAGA